MAKAAPLPASGPEAVLPAGVRAKALGTGLHRGLLVVPAPPARHQDLVAWGVLERGPPVRFTRRFHGALAWAAAELQASSGSQLAEGRVAVDRQVQTALESHRAGTGSKAGLGHRRFALAVHVASQPEAVRALLGLPTGKP